MGKKTELWRVQVEWKTAEDYDNYSHRSRNKAYVKEWLPFPRTFFDLENARKKLERIPVSYTHLTLPTILLV